MHSARTKKAHALCARTPLLCVAEHRRPAAGPRPARSRSREPDPEARDARAQRRLIRLVLGHLGLRGEQSFYYNGRNLVGGFGTFGDNGQDLTEGDSEKGGLGNDSKRVNYDLAACYQLGLCSTVSAVRERKASTCAVSTYSFLSSIATLQMKCLSPRDDELSYSMV
jgi:hypothetical protein